MGAYRRFGKRALDLVLGTALFAAALPAIAAAALLVKLDSPGPVFHRAVRVGRGGKKFTFLKLRSMQRDAEELRGLLLHLNEAKGPAFKLTNDPRVTRVGRLLRKTSLDELPQLLNVLAGDMSLVGPRPLVVDEDEQITGLDRRRLALTPGMTGPWQILGSRVPLAEMVKLDYLYAASWSLWQDAKIMLRTVPYVLARRGM
jgi:lipopolysaccharide/colanic/teichoic acid biosynthesis glycosyltransferase